MIQKTTVTGSVFLLVILLATACSGGATPTPTATPLRFPTFTATVAAPSPAAAVPTVIIQATRMVVGNTGGGGAMLRKTPGGDSIRGLLDGTIVELVSGTEEKASGRAWKNVKDPNGNVGWVATDFLVNMPATAATPAARAATPTPTR